MLELVAADDRAAGRRVVDPNHQLFGNSADVLKAFDLLDDESRLLDPIWKMLLASWEEGSSALLDPIDRSVLGP